MPSVRHLGLQPTKLWSPSVCLLWSKPTLFAFKLVKIPYKFVSDCTSGPRDNEYMSLGPILYIFHLFSILSLLIISIVGVMQCMVSSWVLLGSKWRNVFHNYLDDGRGTKQSVIAAERLKNEHKVEDIQNRVFHLYCEYLF